MTRETVRAASRGGPRQIDFSLRGWLPLVLGFGVLAIPTMLTLADQTWSQEAGAHGPIVLATGSWLLWRQSRELDRLSVPENAGVTLFLLPTALLFYIFGRAYDFLTFEVAGLYAVALVMAHAKLGSRAMLKNWFPFFYLAFLIPPPTYLMDSLTAPLKRFVSVAATDVLQPFGIPVGNEGVIIYVAQYQLLVEDACAGLNSLVGLLAIGLFYIYLRRGQSWTYTLFLAALIVPIAILVNVLRVEILILLTYFFGDRIAQGFLHMAAGVFMFGGSVLIVFGIDKFLHYARPLLRQRT